MKRIVNTVKKDNSQRKIKAITKTFSIAVKEIDDPRTWEVDYPLREILFTALVAVCCGSESYRKERILMRQPWESPLWNFAVDRHARKWYDSPKD